VERSTGTFSEYSYLYDPETFIYTTRPSQQPIEARESAGRRFFIACDSCTNASAFGNSSSYNTSGGECGEDWDV
jgi:hypothetical protein